MVARLRLGEFFNIEFMFWVKERAFVGDKTMFFDLLLLGQNADLLDRYVYDYRRFK